MKRRDSAKDLPSFTEGVRVGLGVKLPRVPAVYTRKGKWRLKEQEDPDAYLWHDGVQGVNNENYVSAKELAEAVKDQLELSAVKGQALKFTEEAAKEKYGDSLVLASLRALVKRGAKETRDLTVRMLFDGTHGVPINSGIRARDQDRSPAAPDLKRVLRCLASQSGPMFGFKVDVKDAHRFIPIRSCDWHLLSCWCEKSKDVHVSKTGYVRSSQRSVLVEQSGHSSRARSSLPARTRASDVAPPGSRRPGDAHNPPQDQRVDSPGLIFLRVMGFPLSWRKCAGGEVLQWVGFELVLRNTALELSASRAQWLEGWHTRLLRDEAT